MKHFLLVLLLLFAAGSLNAKHFEDKLNGFSFELPEEYYGEIRRSLHRESMGSVVEHYWGAGEPIAISFTLAAAELPRPDPKDDTVVWNGLKVKRIVHSQGVMFHMPLRGRGLLIGVGTSENRVEEAKRISLLLISSFKATPSRPPDVDPMQAETQAVPQEAKGSNALLLLLGAGAMVFAAGLLGWFVLHRPRANLRPAATRIIAVAPEIAASETKCRGCGAPLAPGRKRCMNCGADCV
jgi:hypothetical protein